jgi:putative effector of murein hydrolase
MYLLFQCGDGGYYRPRNMILHGKFTGPADPQLIAVMVLLFLLILGKKKYRYYVKNVQFN